MTQKKNKKKILVIRHGESVWNVLHEMYPSEEERYHPRMCTVDCGITEKGVQQAKQAGKELAQQIESIDLLVVSPLRRALQTVQYILENFPSKPARTIVSKEISEVMVDPCDIGSLPSTLTREFPEWDFSHLEQHWWHGSKSPEVTLSLMTMRKGLEEDTDVQRRLESFREFLRHEKESETIVVVCHSDIIGWLKGRVEGEKPAKNGEILDLTDFILPTSND